MTKKILVTTLILGMWGLFSGMIIWGGYHVSQAMLRPQVKRMYFRVTR